MELISEEEKDRAAPPGVLTIKRGAKMQWQDFVDRDAMGTFRGPDSPGCKTLGGFRPKRSGSIGPPQGRNRCPPPTLQLHQTTSAPMGALGSSTLPRNLKKRHQEVSASSGGDHIAMELESLRYKNVQVVNLPPL